MQQVQCVQRVVQTAAVQQLVLYRPVGHALQPVAVPDHFLRRICGLSLLVKVIVHVTVGMVRCVAHLATEAGEPGQRVAGQHWNVERKKDV